MSNDWSRGGNIGPLFGHNPLRMRGLAVPANAVALPVHWLARDVGGDFTTTNVGGTFRPVTGTVTTKMRSSVLFLTGYLRARHSAPPASVDVYVELWYGETAGSGTGFTIARALGVLLDSATNNTVIHLSAISDLAYNGYVPGPHNFSVAITNNTTGTLTVVGGLSDFTFMTMEVGVAGPIVFRSS